VRRLLDADVLIGALDRNDARHAQARDRLTRWRQHQDDVMISAINLSEVLIAPSADPARLAIARGDRGAGRRGPPAQRGDRGRRGSAQTPLSH
jgi:hypothetical protein